MNGNYTRSRESLALGLSLGLLGVACAKDDRQNPAVAKVAERTVRYSDFHAYLEFKKQATTDVEQFGKQLEAYVDREAIADAIRSQGKLDARLVRAELRELEKDMLINRYFDEYLRTAVTKQKVEQYYAANGPEWTEERVRVAHVLVRVDRNSPAEVRKQKKMRIEAAVAALNAGTSFGEVARNYSDDRVSANRDGDMGWLREGAIDPEFSKEVASLELEGVSRPFETKFGFHVVKLLDGPKKETKPLSAVEADIRYRLRAEAKTNEVRRLRASKPVSLNRVAWPQMARERPEEGRQ